MDSSPLAAIFSGVKASYGGHLICSGTRFEKSQQDLSPGKRVIKAKFNESDIFGEYVQKGEVPEFIHLALPTWINDGGGVFLDDNGRSWNKNPA